MGLFNWSLLAVAAVTAILPLTSSAAVLPRDGPSGFYLQIKTDSTTPAAMQGYNGYLLQAANGKFWVGGPYHSTALMSCGKSDGSNTTCSLNVSAGPQQLYQDDQSALRFTAPNAPVPSGLLADAANFRLYPESNFIYAIARPGDTSVWNPQYIMCKGLANDGSYQILSLHNYGGCPGGAASGMVSLVPTGNTIGYSGPYST